MIFQNHYRLNLGGGTLTQLANRSVTQMMSYIIDCPDGDMIVIDGGIRIEILSEPICYENYPTINPTSMIFKVHFPKQSVLFLGDFDVHGEANYEKYFSVEKLRCDIVQMAHHGQDAVSRSFYHLIQPKYCLYPTPDWLWENNKYGCNDPETRGTGRFTTLETRLWMAELKIVRSFHVGEGDLIFT